MRAVILAAGAGTRMRQDLETPKPLINLLGLPLITRNILSLRACGIDEFVIITGRYRQELENYLGDGKKHQVKITYLHNPDWQLGNGVSAYAFRKIFQPQERFILMMADHMFNLKDLQAFVAAAKANDAEKILLAADRRLERVWDLPEATKIIAENGLALKLGKDLQHFNAVDGGLFAGNELLLAALEKAISQENYSLTAAINFLAADGKVKLHFLQEDWVDVDDLASFKQAEKILLKSLLPPKDGFISRTINRKFSLPLTKVLSKTVLTPNQITFISFLVALAAAVAFALRRPFWGGILTQLTSILDGVDGEIARLKFLQSDYGGLFDAILDRYADFFIVLGMACGWYLETESLVVFLIGAIALSGLPKSMLIKEKFQALTGKTFVPWLYDGVFRYLPANRDGRLFLIMLGGIFNLVPATLVVLAVICHVQAVARLLMLRKLI